MTPEDKEAEARSAAAAALGRARTPRKAATSAANIAKANAVREVAPCTCGQDPHKYSCPRYAAEASARYRAKKQKQKEGLAEEG